MNDPNMNKQIVSQDLDSRTIEVQEDGSIKVTEVVKVVYKQQFRDFLSDVRNMQKFREQVEDTLKPDFAKKQQERIDKVNKDIDELQPYVNDAEKKWMEYQEKKRHEDMADKLKEELKKSDKDVNVNYIAAIYDNVKKNDKVLSLLSDEEKERFKKLKLKSMKKR